MGTNLNRPTESEEDWLAYKLMGQASMSMRLIIISVTIDPELMGPLREKSEILAKKDFPMKRTVD